MDALNSKNVLVLGLGNTLLADDGVGVHVARRVGLDPATPSWVRAVDGGTMGFRLTSILCGCLDVLIIDAADFSASPGTIRLLDEETLGDHVTRTRRTSAHEAGLADLLSLIRVEDFLLRHLAVLAIQPSIIDWGETLSGPVEKAIGPACAMVTKTAIEWRSIA